MTQHSAVRDGQSANMTPHGGHPLLRGPVTRHCIPSCGFDLAEIRELLLYGDSNKFGSDVIPGGTILKSNGRRSNGHWEQKYNFNIFVSSDLDL